MLSFRKSTMEDLASIEKIIKDAVEGMKREGLDQWQKGYPSPRLFMEDVQSGVGYVAVDGQGVAGVCAIMPGPEKNYEKIQGSWLDEACSYGAIHRVAVRMDCRGKGVALFLFGEFEKLAKAWGVASIRADTHKENVPMRKSLERYGFQACGTIQLIGGEEDGGLRVGYEKKISLPTPSRAKAGTRREVPSF